MVRLFEMLSWLESVIGLVTVVMSKLIVSPARAVNVAWRSVQVAPGQVPPESALLLTVIVAAGALGFPSKGQTISPVLRGLTATLKLRKPVSVLIACCRSTCSF